MLLVIGLIVGVFIGAFIGVALMALLNAAGRADEMEEIARLNAKKKD